MTDREVMQMALEALENTSPLGFFNMESDKKFFAAITALRARLADPEPEPFGYLWPTGRHPEFRFTQQKRDGVDGMPLYTSPPARRPLTPVEIAAMWRKFSSEEGFTTAQFVRKFARAIEAAHGIKEPE